jgi:tRNA pseudouridine38-40 synthase
MVRNIVGSLIRVGKGEQPPRWLGELLVLRDRTQAAETAPAAGLYFVTAIYPDQLDIPRRRPDCVVWACQEVDA